MTVLPDEGSLLSGIPESLRDELLGRFEEIIENYRSRRWEPSELNGGKFSEVVYSILKGQASGKFPKKASKPQNFPQACRNLENETGMSRSERIQIPRMLVSLYEIRNNRNVGHVGGDVDPNHMDATCVVAIAKWVMAELIRVFHDVDTDTATEAVDALVEREVPIIWEVAGKRRVLRTDLSTRDKLLLLLYGVPQATDDELIDWLEYGNASRLRTKVLAEMHKDRLIEYNRVNGSVTLSPRGAEYVEENLPLSR